MTTQRTNETRSPWGGGVDLCTLPTTERPLRMAEFDELFASVRSIDRISESRARLLLGGDAALAERAGDLAEAESACCSFFTFRVTAIPDGGDPGLVALDVEVPAARADVLSALLARAEMAAGQEP